MTESNDPLALGDVRTQLNDEFKGQIAVSHSDYTSVSVLVLYWKDGDHEGFKTEAEGISNLFREKFRYHVEIVPIPTEKSQLSVEKAITDLLLEHANPSSLIIIHYGGHGDRDDDHRQQQQKQSVWAALRMGGPTVNWWSIQPKLLDADVDVLLLLDCCCAAQAGRDRFYRGYRCELLAACAMGISTPAPGKYSFTTAVKRELLGLLAEGKEILTSHLHSRLVKKEANLTQTPIWIDLRGTTMERNIRLRPLPSPQEAVESTHRIADSLASLTFKASMQDLNPKVLQDIVRWLKTEVPPAISGLEVEEVVYTTQRLHNLVFDSGPGTAGSGPIFDRFSEAGKADILESWNPLSRVLSAGSTHWPYVPPTPVNLIDTVRRQASAVFNQLRAYNAAFLQSVQRNILAMPESYDPAQVAELAENQDAQAVGLSETLRIRQIIVTQSPHTSLPVPIEITLLDTRTTEQRAAICGVQEGHLADGTSVLIEYKTYNEKDRFGDYASLYVERVQQLTRLLNLPKTANFHTLKCLQWFEERENHRFGLIFERPPSFDGSPTSLLAIMDSSSSSSSSRSMRPSLGQRFEIAHKISRALEEWHSVGWVHQSICSRNVILFRRSDSANWEFSSPYLGGFEFARPNTAPSIPRFVDDFKVNIYRHPKRHGVPQDRFRKEHDLYSFGVLLLEIGLWLPVTRLFPQKFLDGSETISPQRLRGKLQQYALERLGHYMGNSYRDAVNACLSESWNVEMDDRAQSQLAKAFHNIVVEPLALGINLK